MMSLLTYLQARSPHHMQVITDFVLCMPSAEPNTFQMYAMSSPPPEAAISGCAGFHATANTASAQATSLMTGSETVQRLASRAQLSASTCVLREAVDCIIGDLCLSRLVSFTLLKITLVPTIWIAIRLAHRWDSKRSTPASIDRCASTSEVP